MFAKHRTVFEQFFRVQILISSLTGKIIKKFTQMVDFFLPSLIKTFPACLYEVPCYIEVTVIDWHLFLFHIPLDNSV